MEQPEPISPEERPITRAEMENYKLLQENQVLRTQVLELEQLANSHHTVREFLNHTHNCLDCRRDMGMYNQAVVQEALQILPRDIAATYPNLTR